MPTMARAHPLTRQRLDQLQTALQSDEGIVATHEEIIGALVHANTVAQLVCLLPVYRRHIARAPDEAQETP